jgi:hypothetical protein
LQPFQSRLFDRAPLPAPPEKCRNLQSAACAENDPAIMFPGRGGIGPRGRLPLALDFPRAAFGTLEQFEILRHERTESRLQTFRGVASSRRLPSRVAVLQNKTRSILLPTCTDWFSPQHLALRSQSYSALSHAGKLLPAFPREPFVQEPFSGFRDRRSVERRASKSHRGPLRGRGVNLHQ